ELKDPEPISKYSLADWKENAWEKEAEIRNSIKEPDFPKRVYDISEFGAEGDGSSDARPAILEAIEKANGEGGGIVNLPEGTWFSKGPIQLKSNINLHLEEGAKLLFSEKPED